MNVLEIKCQGKSLLKNMIDSNKSSSNYPSTDLDAGITPIGNHIEQFTCKVCNEMDF